VGSEVLLVSDSNTYLSATDGTPIFPVVDNEDLRAVVAGSRGCVLRSAADFRRERSSVKFGVVAAIGDEMGPAAGLYAHLTQRDTCTVSSVAAALEVGGVEVLILHWSQLTIKALRQVARARPTVGLIVADSRSARHQVLSRAAFAMRPETSEPRSTLIVGNGFAPPRAHSTIAIVPPNATVEDAQRALSNDSDILGVLAHSDGIDLRLPGEAVLCPFAHQGDAQRKFSLRPRATPTVPVCISTAYCRRVCAPLTAALASSRLVAPATINCGTLLLFTCFGALGVDSHVPSQLGLISSLLENPSIGAFVATWGIAFTDSACAVALMSLCNSSKLGHALDRFQSHSAVQDGQFRPLLFGDPRAGHDSLGHTSALESCSEQRVSIRAPRLDAGTRVLHALISTADRVHGDAAITARATETLANYVAQPTPEGLRITQAAILATVAPLGSAPVHLWTSLVTKYSLARDTKPTACFSCRRRLEVFEAHGLESVSRWLYVCERCGIVIDTDNDPQRNTASEAALRTWIEDSGDASSDTTVAWVSERADGRKLWGLLPKSRPPVATFPDIEMFRGFLAMTQLRFSAIRLSF
jgi:hypothetical protein